MAKRIRGKLVTLRPTVEADRRKVFDWLANSDITAMMLGPPKFPDQAVPTWEEFCADYVPHYFDDSDPQLGRCFIIVAEEEDVGCVTYNDLNHATKETELDIWLGSRSVLGKGYGRDALETISRYLAEEFGIAVVIIRPSARNTGAIAAYQRAGFVLNGATVAEHEALYGEGDYADSVLLKKTPTPRS